MTEFLFSPPPQVFQYKDLGFANGWSARGSKTASECREKRHTINIVHINGRYRGHKMYYCDECKYRYEVDSGD